MTIEESFHFLSKDGKTKIHAIKWIPQNGKYQAVLQISHGMIEYIERYRPFAEYLNQRGFLVVGHDHLGHGASVTSEEEWGFFTEKHPSDTLIADMHTLRTKIGNENQGLPYFMMAHSMGSYMLRKYLCLHGEGLAGAVIMGTGYMPDRTMRFGMGICRGIALLRGWHYRSRFVQSLSFNKYYRKYDVYGKDYKNSWLSKNSEDVEAYYRDPRCTFRFTVNGYYGLMEAVYFDHQPENIKKTPRHLPLLFVSGADDPVGNCGAGVKKVCEIYQKAGFSDITCKLYENDRHEILNEPDHDKVFADIADWLAVRVEK